MIKKVLQEQLRLIHKHFLIFSILIVLSVFLIVHYIEIGAIYHGFGYLIAVYLGIFIVDCFTIARPKSSLQSFKIKKPIKKELFIILGCTLLGILYVSIRFYSDWNNLNGWLKLSILPLLLFAFPIFLGLIYILVFKYRIKDLGINLNYWYLPIFIHIIFGVITLTFAPKYSHWHLLVNDGTVKWLFTGFIVAALSEEFTRMLILTRVGKYAKNMAFGLLISSVVWASMHFPEFSQNYQVEGWIPSIFSVLNLIPLGIFWGYVTFRTKSIIPTIFIHGLNFWGLQNF